MATPATLEQWKELYDLAIEITKLKPWNSYWDMDLIAVETKKNEEPNFVSIMGKSGTCTGISVYRGMEGYSDFCQIYNDDYNVPATFVMSDQNCITCYWGNRDEIDDEMYSIIKQLGLRFCGNGNWIYFKTFENIKYAFKEFSNYNCPFRDCTHTKEKECMIKKAVDDSEILKSRYDSYLKFYEEAIK